MAQLDEIWGDVKETDLVGSVKPEKSIDTFESVRNHWLAFEPTFASDDGKKLFQRCHQTRELFVSRRFAELARQALQCLEMKRAPVNRAHAKRDTNGIESEREKHGSPCSTISPFPSKSAITVAGPAGAVRKYACTRCGRFWSMLIKSTHALYRSE